MNNSNRYEQLEKKIVTSYSEGVTISDAESLAAEFLEAMLLVSSDLRQADLDTRMRKTGLKAVKAAVLLEEARKGDKKPADSLLAALVDRSELVISEQKSFDTAENEKESLERLFSVFKESHVHFRGISKGKYD